jgi:hypothetical protein
MAVAWRETVELRFTQDYTRHSATSESLYDEDKPHRRSGLGCSGREEQALQSRVDVCCMHVSSLSPPAIFMTQV